jgi:hypothetical protein
MVEGSFGNGASSGATERVKGEMSGKIEDPVDTSINAWPEQPKGWDQKLPELALSASGSSGRQRTFSRF